MNADKDNKEIGMPRGEILIGGPGVCDGYLVDPAAPDPDVVASIGGQRRQSKVVEKSLEPGFNETLAATLEAFNAHASSDGLDPMGRGVPGTTAYESSMAWWQFAFAYDTEWRPHHQL